MEYYPNEILFKIFAYLDFPTRLACKQCCHRWYEILGSAKEFKNDRRLALNEDFRASVLKSSETLFSTLIIRELDIEQDFHQVWEKVEDTVENLEFNTTNWKIIHFVLTKAHFPNVRHLIFKYVSPLARRGNSCLPFKLSDFPHFPKVQSIEVNVKEICNTPEELQNYLKNLPNLRRLVLNLEKHGNTEDLFKAVCAGAPRLEELEINCTNWEAGISYDVVLRHSAKFLRYLKLFNMVKFQTSITTDAGLSKLFQRYLELNSVTLNHYNASIQPAMKRILIKSTVPQNVLRALPFVRVIRENC